MMEQDKKSYRSSNRRKSAKGNTKVNAYKKVEVKSKDVKCPKCSTGVLTRRMWNRLLCTNDGCNYSQLQ